MPARDGTGPAGLGAGAGRGMGGCASATANGQQSAFGTGCQHRAGRGGMQSRGFGRGLNRAYPTDTQKEALEQQRSALQQRLDQIDAQLKTA